MRSECAPTDTGLCLPEMLKDCLSNFDSTQRGSGSGEGGTLSSHGISTILFGGFTVALQLT